MGAIGAGQFNKTVVLMNVSPDFANQRPATVSCYHD